MTAKDIEMCVCKLHLEARTAVNALVSLAVKQNLDMKGIKDYDMFFTFLTTDCKKDDHTYIAWECTQDKKALCMHIQNRWKIIQQILAPASDPEITANLTCFVKKAFKTKKGAEHVRLEQETVKADINAVLEFIDQLLPRIIHHRNHLRHYRNCVKSYAINNDCVELDIDFSEKLSVPLKYEPQSMHWTNSLVIVHSGIKKSSGKKTYHTCISDDMIQDHVFVGLVLDEMLEDVCIDGKKILLHSDNCSAQYKCAAHFSKLQDMADSLGVTVVRMYGIAGHRENEVDHVE